MQAHAGQPADMVAVQMRDQNRIDIRGLDASTTLRDEGGRPAVAQEHASF
jgi:hypothetical protein